MMNTPGNSITPFAWGVIGTGAAARDFTTDLQYVTERSCFVKAVLGAEGPELQDFTDTFHVPLSYTDMQAFLEESQVDAVFIAAPAPFRYPYVIRCLQGGVPVLCEAPLSLSTAQAANLAEVSARTGVFLMEGMSLRFLPSLYVVLSLLHTRKIGEIISIRVALTGKVSPDDEGQGALPEGGALLNLGSYPLFLSQFLLGEPLTVKATGRMTPDGSDEYCTCLLSYENGGYASVECSLISDIKNEAVITGSKGVITIGEPWNEKTEGISIAIGGEVVVYRECTWEGRGIHFEVTEVLHCLDEGMTQSELMTHAMSLRMAGVMEEIRGQLQIGKQEIRV
jgi:predicted dehydrogenase